MRHFDSKILTWDTIEPFLKTLRDRQARIVTTNGCFDLMHLGHVTYLQEARELGNALLVAINSDRSVKELKGDSRPIYSERERAALVASLECVDGVLIFDEPTPVRFIEVVRPSLHVKGGDYVVEEMPETSVVRSTGGDVRCISFVAGYSTSATIERIHKSYRTPGVISP